MTGGRGQTAQHQCVSAPQVTHGVGATASRFGRLWSLGSYEMHVKGCKCKTQRMGGTELVGGQ